MTHLDVEVVAVCDVYKPNLDSALKLAGGKAKVYHDYRRLLEDKDVEAVVIATPEHWHALMCIDSCNAGKDVFVEKPASHNIREGRLMIQAARRNNRIVQVGTQQRSGTHFQRAVRCVREGRIGDVLFAICWHHSQPTAAPPSAAAPATGPSAPPPDLDYDLWLGRAAMRPISEVWPTARRGSWDFYGGLLTEWGTHMVDIVLWGTGKQGPKSVVATGGQFMRKGGELPDTMQVTWEYDNFLLNYSILPHNTFGPNGDPGANHYGSYGIQFHGTKGTLFVDRAGYRLTPQSIRRAEPNLPPIPPRFWNDERELGYYYTTETLPESGDSSEMDPPHSRHFLNSVKSRQRPIADIEDGHYANTVCRLGNIAYRLRRRVNWDAAKEQAIGDAEANKLVVGTYRAPWIPKGL